MNNAKSHKSKWNLVIIEELYLKCIAYSPFSPDIALSDFFLFEWLKSEPASLSVSEISEVFEVGEEILSTLTTETIAKVFRIASKD
jgi:hypothetical protein